MNILNYYSNKNPAIHVLHQKNSGVSAARNLALNSIEHDESIKYVSFVDSDDIISKDFVSTFVKELTSKNADYGVCGRVCNFLWAARSRLIDVGGDSVTK